MSIKRAHMQLIHLRKKVIKCLGSLRCMMTSGFVEGGIKIHSPGNF